MAARNRARTPVRIRCIKKTTPPETSCGTPEEAYKVPPSLTVAIRDQQLRLVPSRRPRPEQHSPRIPLVPRALLRALETELLDQRAPFHVLGRDVAAHLLDRRRVVRDEADGRGAAMIRFISVCSRSAIGLGVFDGISSMCQDIAGPVGACAYATPDTTRCPNKIFFVRMVAVQRRRRGTGEKSSSSKSALTRTGEQVRNVYQR